MSGSLSILSVSSDSNLFLFASWIHRKGHSNAALAISLTFERDCCYMITLSHWIWRYDFYFVGQLPALTDGQLEWIWTFVNRIQSLRLFSDFASKAPMATAQNYLYHKSLRHYHASFVRLRRTSSIYPCDSDMIEL